MVSPSTSGCGTDNSAAHHGHGLGAQGLNTAGLGQLGGENFVAAVYAERDPGGLTLLLNPMENGGITHPQLLITIVFSVMAITLNPAFQIV